METSLPAESELDRGLSVVCPVTLVVRLFVETLVVADEVVSTATK